MNVREVEVVYGRKTPAGQFASETVSIAMRGKLIVESEEQFMTAVHGAFMRTRQIVEQQLQDNVERSNARQQW